MTSLRYRGVSYDTAQHEQPAAAVVVHTYRGLPYSSSLHHEAAAADPRDFRYRGQVYRHPAEASHA